MTKKTSILIIFIFLIVKQLYSQVSPGQWRDHMSYNNSKKVILAKDRVYCVSDLSLYYYNISDKSINKLSKVNGLSDVEFADLEFSEKHNTLIIAYKNGNIDFIKGNVTENMPQLKNKLSIADKTINSLYINDDFVYFNTNFGIMKVEITTKEIIDTWYPSSDGQNNKVYASCIFHSNIYVSTEKGLFYAPIENEFLANYKYWTLDPNISYNGNIYKQILNFNSKYLILLNATNGKVFTNKDNWQELILTGENTYTIAISDKHLIATSNTQSYIINDNLQNIDNIPFYLPNYTIKYGNYYFSATATGLVISNDGNQIYTTPNGPASNNCYKFNSYNNKIWVASGLVKDIWDIGYISSGAYVYENNQWRNINLFENSETSEARDILSVCVDPYDESHFFLTSWAGQGVLEYKNNKFSKKWDYSNSSLQAYQNWNGKLETKVYNSAIDANGNYWFSNSGWYGNNGIRKPISVLDRQGKWYSIGFENISSNLGYVGTILITSWGHKWTFTTKESELNILVFDDKGTFENTADDEYKKFSIVETEGNEVSSEVVCMAEDQNATIWVGTKEGPVVYYNPQSVFESELLYASRIKVPVLKKSPDATLLLEKIKINGIAIDGANRKWMATGGAGVYYLSEDGTEELLHFNAENSPLPSDIVYDVAVDSKTGEVFFATDKGMVSYRGYSTNNNNNFGKVYVYPNPVKPGYDGDIVVTGLANNINVKITDISGNLVFETESLGGQAIWNGRNLRGNKVNTGVYLVFCTNKDGSKTKMTKFMVFK